MRLNRSAGQASQGNAPLFSRQGAGTTQPAAGFESGATTVAVPMTPSISRDNCPSERPPLRRRTPTNDLGHRSVKRVATLSFGEALDPGSLGWAWLAHLAGLIARLRRWGRACVENFDRGDQRYSAAQGAIVLRSYGAAARDRKPTRARSMEE
jgi:hypothetical protein